MDIVLKKSLEGTGHDFKVGETIEDAEKIFGPAQAAYLLESGHAEPVKAKTKTADAK